MDANIIKIGSILKKGRQLEIPFFQRSYVWGEDEWERLLEDFRECCIHKKEHFMGSCIIKEQSDSSKESRLVIDGQQRLTTIYIFFKALCMLKEKNADFDKIFYNSEKNYS